MVSILLGLHKWPAAIIGATTLLSLQSAPAFAQVDATTLRCDFGKAVKSGDGKLRLAMIVGVNKYKNLSGEDQLKGPVPDAGKFYDLIVDDEAKVFPRQNVCVLTDEEVTYQGFKTAFQKALVDRADGANDVVIYYAGHGSQLRDRNNDDGDGWDETLFLYDSSIRERPREGLHYNQLRDDEFNGMLAALQKKTRHFTVILDSCHSGTATRDIGGDEKSRFVDPDLSEADRASPTSVRESGGGDGGYSYADFTPANFPGAVILSASRDDETAKERAGVGYFTNALITVLRRNGRITYNQLAAQISDELGSKKHQTPVLSGDGERFVFSSDIPYRPRFDWVVASVDGENAVIRGLPTIGMGEGAEFLILPGSMTAEQAKDPMIAKARMRATQLIGTNEWRLEPIRTFNRGVIESGDLAKLVLPAASARRLKIRIRPAGEIGGILNASAFAQQIREKVPDVLEAGDVSFLQFITSGDYDFEIARDRGGALQILDSEGVLRNAYENSETDDMDALTLDLSNHLQQLVLLNEWKITGGSLVPNKSLQVSLKPVVDDEHNACKQQYKGVDWPGPANTPQRIPVCAAFEVHVKLDKDAKTPLIIAASVMSADGSMFALPSDQRRMELGPGGEEQVFDIVFQATPDTYSKPEHIFVIGLPASSTAGEPAYQIPWHLLSTPTEFLARAAPVGEVKPPIREFGTYTQLPIETVANPGFGETTADNLNASVIKREYTINNFDIAPYLPDDRTTALHRVLKVAESLTDFKDSGDGVAYKQHSWCGRSDETNLADGIDCSRAIWYAFTRAGVSYNRYSKTEESKVSCTKSYDPERSGYLYTGDMARKDSLMSDNFENCLEADINPEGKFELGDVLVYRDRTKGDGHVVMVIDPEKRIAWGSHGWDGNPRLIDENTGKAPDVDRGIEFQKIKFKSDWKRWDRSTMELAACWRHKKFIAEKESGAGRPGFAALCQMIDLENRYVKDNLCWKLLR